ncbi:MAG: glycerol-3-phosphate 1-O-acyltransferase PlsY [Hyphomicrobiales bacterium]|nr:glycerol-3-phosphate 1-O-acyltransferase PlsY [Hyphomicrobiales bacterium]MDE2016424.1 glycerol-3-phosphate 1-O-acyltransferase PlsY [Hyphomicrobiales bacterium]
MSVAFAALAASMFGYLCGSVPFGLLLTRAAGLGDVRKIGSGNIGATNVLRSGRKDLAAATLAFDALKGTVAVLVAKHFGIVPAHAAALGAFAGHLFPAWLEFKGGKGVATFLGCLLGYAWPAALTFALIWLGVAYATRYSSAAALAASVAATLSLLVFAGKPAFLVYAAMTAMLWLRHRANLSRLLAGSESRIGAKG